MNMQTNKTIATTIDVGTGTLVIRTSDHPEIVLTLEGSGAHLMRHAALHGFKQKIVDAAALSRNPDTGRSATVADKYRAMLAVYNQLLSGSWNKRAGDGSSTGSGGLLFRALCLLYPTKTPSDIKTFLDGKTKAEQATLRKNPRVATIIETLREDEEEDETDTDAMLDELTGE